MISSSLILRAQGSGQGSGWGNGETDAKEQQLDSSSALPFPFPFPFQYNPTYLTERDALFPAFWGSLSRRHCWRWTWKEPTGLCSPKAPAFRSTWAFVSPAPGRYIVNINSHHVPDEITGPAREHLDNCLQYRNPIHLIPETEWRRYSSAVAQMAPCKLIKQMLVARLGSSSCPPNTLHVPVPDTVTP